MKPAAHASPRATGARFHPLATRLAASVFAAASLAAAIGPANADSTGVLSGNVINNFDKQGIANALIEVGSLSEPGFLTSTTTDSSGRFKIGSLPPGTFQVLLSPKGFEGYETEVTIVAGSTDHLLIYLNPLALELHGRR